MGMYCLNMLAIDTGAGQEDPAYEDVASKIFRAFRIQRPGHGTISHWRAVAMGRRRRFYYDVLKLPRRRTFS